MRQILFCLLTLLIPKAGPKVVMGTILADGQPIPGCEIKLIGTDLKTITNSNGEYNLSFESDIDRFTLEISFMEKSIYATTRVEDVHLSSDSLDLGNLSLFVNKSITVEEYKKLHQETRRFYQEVNHWNTKLGYLSKTEIDTTVVSVHCPFDQTRLLKHKYDRDSNKVIIDYKDILICKAKR